MTKAANNVCAYPGVGGANAVENKPKHVFVRSSCKEPLSMEVVASFRHEIRASAGYQLSDSLNDDGGMTL